MAAIDIGTNAVRLLIAHAGPDHNFKPLFSNRIITRLGEGVAHTGYLSPNAIERTLQVLKPGSRGQKDKRGQKGTALFFILFYLDLFYL